MITPSTLPGVLSGAKTLAIAIGAALGCLALSVPALAQTLTGTKLTVSPACAAGNPPCGASQTIGASISGGLEVNNERITNVAPGVNPTDAVNVSQLNDLTGDVSALRKDLSNVTRAAYRGIAEVAALTSGAPAVPGKTTVNLGVGAYNGYVAGAVTASRMSEDGRFNFNGGIGTTGGKPAFRAGVGFSF